MVIVIIILISQYRWTVELVRRAEHVGVAWITVHGRTARQRTEPANMDAVKLIKTSVNIPVVANGDIRTLDDVDRVVQATGVNGVMSARGILHNPALFSGALSTPLECVQDWVDVSLRCGISFTLFHHHLMYMMEKLMPKSVRNVFNALRSTPAVLDFLNVHFDIQYQPI